jgi:hypothetical protein
MQGDDVGMGTYLSEHLDFSMSRERIGSGQHNGKRDLAASFQIPSTVGLFTRALSDQMIDAVPAGEKRALGKRNIHTSQIVALPTGDRIPNKSARAGPDVQKARGRCLGVKVMGEVPAQRYTTSAEMPCHAALSDVRQPTRRRPCRAPAPPLRGHCTGIS